MLRTIAIYGCIAGVIVGGFLFGGMVLTPDPASNENGALIGYTVMIIALTAVFLGVKAHRDGQLGGVIKFLPAFLMGLGISAVAGLFWMIAWEAALAVTGFDFAASYSEAMLEQARGGGASAAELEKAAADAEAFAKMYANPLIRMPITFAELFPVGAVISLISALLLRNSRFMPARRASA